MDAGKIIYGRLSADATITGHVGTKIFPVAIPQNTNFPAIVYAIETTFPSDEKDGPSKLDENTVAVRIFTGTYATSVAIAERVRVLLDRFTGTVAGVTTDGIKLISQDASQFDKDLEFFVVELGFSVRIKRTP